MHVVALAFSLCTQLIPSPEAELLRFPSAAFAATQVRLAEAHVEWLGRERSWYGVQPEAQFWWMDGAAQFNPQRWETYSAWLREAQECECAWTVLANAHGYTAWADKWECLHRLREMLPPEDYYTGRMPPAVPLHRFTELQRPLPVERAMVLQ